MLFAFPPNAAFNRVVPKTKFYEHAKPSASLKAKFVSEITQIVWSYKLAPETINLPASDGVHELQVFTVHLKADAIDEGVLRAIDRAIPSQILFEVHREKDAKTIAAFKRPSESDSSNWVVGEYFDTTWVAKDSERSKLPMALSMGSLYEQLLKGLSPVPCRTGESLGELFERVANIQSKRNESKRIAAKLKLEKQFNRRVELNSRIRQLEIEISQLSQIKCEAGN